MILKITELRLLNDIAIETNPHANIGGGISAMRFFCKNTFQNYFGGLILKWVKFSTHFVCDRSLKII